MNTSQSKKINIILTSVVLLNILLISGYALYFVIKNLELQIILDYFDEAAFYFYSYVLFMFCKAKVVRLKSNFDALKSSLLEDERGILLSYYFPEEEDEIGNGIYNADMSLFTCNRLMNVLHINYMFVFMFVFALIITNQKDVDITSLMTFEFIFSLTFFITITLWSMVEYEKGTKFLRTKELLDKLLLLP